MWKKTGKIPSATWELYVNWTQNRIQNRILSKKLFDNEVVMAKIKVIDKTKGVFLAAGGELSLS